MTWGLYIKMKLVGPSKDILFVFIIFLQWSGLTRDAVQSLGILFSTKVIVLDHHSS